jgi:hypothetical protein
VADPARDRVAEKVVAMALAFPMWGQHKIAWLCGHDGVQVSDATCLRVLRDSGLVLPIDYVRERRDLAKARREAFVAIPTCPNRVWQTDFFELETSGGGTWRSRRHRLRHQPRPRRTGHRDADHTRRDQRDQRRPRPGARPARPSAAR